MTELLDRTDVKRMLVVDDEDGPRQSLNMIFGDEYDVTMADSGEEAIRLSREDPFHVVITDIRMRGLSGIDVLHEVKEIDKHTEVIVLTAFETLETARQAITYGASEYLKKPFDIEHIQSVVERCHQNFLFSTRQEQVIRNDLNQAKTNFLGLVSHELNTPMNGILGFIELLGETNLDEEQLECVLNIRDCSLKYFEHVQDILTYAKLSMNDAPPTQSAFNPATLILKVACNADVPDGVYLDSEIPSDLPELVYGAENEIRLILRKILLNALKFTHQGEVLLRVSHHFRSDNEVQLRFEVKDTGPGIDPALLVDNRLFDAFTQGDSSLKRNYGGLGLGLSLCKRIGELLGGNLTVESEVGKGSTFCFELILPVGET